MITKRTALEELIESKNATAINEMISTKEIALNEALSNVEYFKSIGMNEHAATEKARVQILKRDLEKLNAA